MQFSENQHVKK